MTDLISVIIPCYNVEQYLKKCLDSVLGQTYENLEIMVINDGSTDGTLDILRTCNDSRLKVVDKQNGGVSSARNAGIDIATGKYLTFVDSDDFLEPNMYEQLYAALTHADADISVCNFNQVYDDHTDYRYSVNDGETVNIDADIYIYFAKYCARPRPNNYIWTRLYKTEIVKRSAVRFENYKLGDDTLFNFKLLPHFHRAAFVSDGLYNYYQRGNSNVYTIAKKSNLAAVYADTFESLEKYWRENGFTEWLSVLSMHAASRLRSIFFYSRLAGLSDKVILQNISDGFCGRSIADYLTGAK